jgi:transcriptional regulator with XRE-family HTH domain
MKKLSKITVLKKQRISLGFSQKELASKVGVAVSSIGGYERGENPLCDEISFKISQELKTTRDGLFSPHKKLKGKWIAK